MLNLLSGYETANIKSVPVKAGESVADGNWVVFDGTTGKVIKQASTFDIAAGKAFPVFGGNDVRFDSKQMDVVSIVTASSYVGETDKFAAVTINAGAPLTVANGVLTNATAGASVVAYALTDNTSGTLQFVGA